MSAFFNSSLSLDFNLLINSSISSSDSILTFGDNVIFLISTSISISGGSGGFGSPPVVEDVLDLIKLSISLMQLYLRFSDSVVIPLIIAIFLAEFNLFFNESNLDVNLSSNSFLSSSSVNLEITLS